MNFIARAVLIFSIAFAGQMAAARAAGLLVERAPDPNGTPRPFRGAANVPLRTSIYFELKNSGASSGAELDLKTIRVTLQPERGGAVALLEPGERFTAGASGWVRASGKSASVYIEPGRLLKPATRYTVSVSSQTVRGGKRAEAGSWSFTTEETPAVRRVHYSLDLKTEPIPWRGKFFDGICNVIFCSRAANYGPTYDLMREARAEHPQAWRLRRDFWLSGTDYQRPPEGFFPSNLPNIVRERETRRITAMQPISRGVRLRVEDFFGHAQYGIPSGRRVSGDYRPGDEVLIADGYHDAGAKVLAVDDAGGAVIVDSIPTPSGGWRIGYERPLPSREDPDAPGLFPPGGCYLRKDHPAGTPCYYWGRLDKEWDAARRDGWRLLPNFADAPADLSRNGRSWTTAKDYAEWHEAVRGIAGHIIDRYGKDSLRFTWSVFNEPDLWILFWQTGNDDLQKYYDYTSDGILRAFEDRGYDSKQAFIGGLELGAVFGTNLPPLLRVFLAHCSPRAKASGALPFNAAFADRRLEGKRSRRVEALCRRGGGKGSPCDFISIHSYNCAPTMAAKLICAKEIALEIDPGFYKNLWIDSHESCPDWMPPPDEAAGDVYRGDGYFASWCAAVAHQQLLRAAQDARFACGETILTVWPPPDDFAALNAVTRVIHYRGRHGEDRTETAPMPIFHALNFLSDMGGAYWALPLRAFGAQEVGGFASMDPRGVVRILFYTHACQDTQSRSDASANITIDLAGLPWTGPASVREWRFDREHNSPCRWIKEIAARARRSASESIAPAVYTEADMEQLRRVCQCRSSVLLQAPEPDGRLRVADRVEENGCDFLVIEPTRRADSRESRKR